MRKSIKWKWIKSNLGAFLAIGVLAGFALPAGYCLPNLKRGWHSAEHYAAIGELQLVVVIAVEGLLALWELRGAKEDRKQENIAAMVAREAEHTWNVINDLDRQGAVEAFLSLHPGASEQQERQ